MAETVSRIYRVKNKTTGDVRLVDAQTQARALRHVAADTFEVDVPTTRDALKLGVKVETAGGEE